MKSISFQVTVLSVLAAGLGMIACAAPMEEDVGEDGASAFSAATCKPRAEKAKAEDAAKCKKENPVKNAQACMQPADAAWLSFMEKLNAARAPYQAQIDAVTGECKANVDAMSAFEIIKDENPNYSVAVATIASNDAKEVARLRDLRKKSCEVDVAATLEGKIPADSEYAKLRDQMKATQRTWNDARRKCAQEERSSKAANAACTGEDAYDKAFKACRRDCADLKEAACVPKGYTNPNATCGKLMPEKSFSFSQFANTCDDDKATVCERTDVCNKFDTLQRNATQTNASGGCTIGSELGSLLVKVILKDGKASSVTTECVPNP